jgi:hypothetical protein
MLSYQIQSILFALMSLVAGVYAAGTAALPSGGSGSVVIPLANEPGINVGPIVSPSPELGLSPTEGRTAVRAVKDDVPAEDETVPEGSMPVTATSRVPVSSRRPVSSRIPVSRLETRSPENAAEFGIEAVDYLSEIGFGSEYGTSSPVLHRWQQDLRIQVHGQPTETDMATLLQVTEELDSLIPHLTLEISSVDPNVDVYFVPESSFSSVDPQYVPVNLGFFRVWWDRQEVINRARILISTQGLNQTERSHLIREELTQTMGLFMDSWRYQDSIFYQGWTSTVEYSPLDREIIRLLYSPHLESGMVRPQLQAVFTAD